MHGRVVRGLRQGLLVELQGLVVVALLERVAGLGEGRGRLVGGGRRGGRGGRADRLRVTGGRHGHGALLGCDGVDRLATAASRVSAGVGITVARIPIAILRRAGAPGADAGGAHAVGPGAGIVVVPGAGPHGRGAQAVVAVIVVGIARPGGRADGPAPPLGSVELFRLAYAAPAAPAPLLGRVD